MLNPMRINRRLATILLTFLTAIEPALAFTVPLPEESVRDAYFLGQRRGEAVTEYLAQYQKNLPAPAKGPWISSIEFLTPFAQLVLYSSKQMSYSAQQAVIDHRGQKETVSIEIVIQLTKSYPALITKDTGSRSGTSSGFTIRPGDFWKYFKAKVSVGDKVIEPDDFTGEPNYVCSENGCSLLGATLSMEFPAEVLNAESVTVSVLPPEGDQVAVEFAAERLR
jgi:hypothetical protein